MTDNQQHTMITAAGTGQSPDKWGCPGVHAVDGHEEDRFVITKDDVRPEVRKLLAPHVGAGEHVGRTPAWVPCGLMDLPTLGLFMEDHLHRGGDSVFRMECQDSAGVEDVNWDRWRDGAMEPDWRTKQEWINELRADRAAGIGHSRVRILPRDLTEYALYECAWGYALNAGDDPDSPVEDIRILREGEHDIPAGLLRSEYWLVNEEIAVPVFYDGRGRFMGAGWLGAERSADFLADRDAAWAVAEPFTSWWARHPELHRGRLAA